MQCSDACVNYLNTLDCLDWNMAHLKRLLIPPKNKIKDTTLMLEKISLVPCLFPDDIYK